MDTNTSTQQVKPEKDKGDPGGEGGSWGSERKA